MNFNLKHNPAALNDVKKILEFLSEIHHDLPRRFRNELANTFEELDSFPERWPVLPNSVRAARMNLSKKLRFYIFYHLKETEIRVLRILPQSADPQNWPSTYI